MFSLFLGLMFIGIGYTANALVPEKQFVEREFPYDGLVKELGGMEENKVRITSQCDALHSN